MVRNSFSARVCAVLTALTMLLQLTLPQAFAASSTDSYFSGTGVASSPFVIDSMDALVKMGELINSGNKTYISAYYIISDDIDMSGSEWTPIGNVSNKFKGTLDGRGHTLYELTITDKNSAVGLFGYIYNGTVKNINLSGGSIDGVKDVGSIAGYNAGTISGCTSTAMITSDDVNIGGIAGRNSGTITNCSFDGTVMAQASNVGGIAGISSGKIDGCTTDASIASIDDYAGGIVGSNSGTVINSGSQSYVTAKYAGGIAGSNTGTVANSYNIGDVGEESDYAGGIVGKNSKTITNCYSGESINADAYVSGGIVGYNAKGTASNCYYLSVGNASAVGEKSGGTVTATAMTDKNMRSQKFAETLNSNLDSGYSTWSSSTTVNDGFPVLLTTSESELKIINGEEYQSGDATPPSSDGKTSAVKYTAYASKWFSGGSGSIKYEIVSFNDGTKSTSSSSYYSSKLKINDDTGYIVFTPTRTDAEKKIEIVVTARDSEGYCTGNVTITVNVNAVPENQSGVTNAYINKTLAKFDKEEGNEYNQSIELTMNLYSSNDLLKIVHEDETLEKGVDYTIKNDTYVTIKRAYLTTLDVGSNVLTFIFSEGANAELTIEVTDTSLETYTVKFISAGSTYYVVEDVPHGTTIKLPDNPTKTDASFGGWYEYTSGRGEQFTAKTKVESDTVLYAYWKYKSTLSSSSSSTKVKTYTIKSSAGKGGTISPSGSKTLEEGDKQRYTITADTGYIISDVQVDGESKGAISTYTFNDIEKGHTIKAVFKVDDGTDAKSVHKPYMLGYADYSFRPDQPITRSEAAVIIARISDDFDDMKRYENTFYDINGDIWYQKYIGYAVQKGYLTGYDGDVFMPDNYISRAEFCTLVHKYLGLKLSKKTTRFVDCKGHWADSYIKDLVDLEAINGYQTGMFNPDGAITRAEAAKIINAVRGRTPNIEADMENPFVDIDQYHWAYYEVMEAGVEHMGADLHK
jgi:hypothetical protein